MLNQQNKLIAYLLLLLCVFAFFLFCCCLSSPLCHCDCCYYFSLGSDCVSEEANERCMQSKTAHKHHATGRKAEEMSLHESLIYELRFLFAFAPTHHIFFFHAYEWLGTGTWQPDNTQLVSFSVELSYASKYIVHLVCVSFIFFIEFKYTGTERKFIFTHSIRHRINFFRNLSADFFPKIVFQFFFKKSVQFAICLQPSMQKYVQRVAIHLFMFISCLRIVSWTTPVASMWQLIQKFVN